MGGVTGGTSNILRQHKPGHLLCGAAIAVLGALAVVLLVLQSTASHSTDKRMQDVVAALAQERARAMGAAMSQGLTGACGTVFGSLRNCLWVRVLGLRFCGPKNSGCSTLHPTHSSQSPTRSKTVYDSCLT